MQDIEGTASENVFSFSSLNTPTLLTVIRLICSPLFLPFGMVYLLPYNALWLNWIVALLFGALSLTDFFDGYLARSLKQETMFGQILDPIADKFLFYATLVSLLAAGKIYFYWVIVLVGREIFIMGLRQIAAEHNFSVHVSWLGKVKTALQTAALFFIILNPVQGLGLTGACYWNCTESLLLSVTIFLSLFSAYQYYVSFMQKLRMHSV